MIQALTLDLIYLKLLIVHIQLMTLKSFEPWYAMNVLFENTRFSLCINIRGKNVKKGDFRGAEGAATENFRKLGCLAPPIENPSSGSPPLHKKTGDSFS